jgi:hypothetical protein
MCEGHHHHQHGEQRGRGRGFRFGGRHGFPSREQLVERLTGYREHLERELENVEELLGRLGDAATDPQPEI